MAADELTIDHSVLDQIRAIEPPGQDLVGNIIKLFIDESERLKQCLVAAVNDGNCEAVREYAHSLKSCSANVGALRVASLSREMESAGRDAERPRLVELLPGLVDGLEKATAELRDLQDCALGF